MKSRDGKYGSEKKNLNKIYGNWAIS